MMTEKIPEIVGLRILGYDDTGKEYDLSDIISDETDAVLSDDIEEWRQRWNYKLELKLR